ncbi:DUF4232 domain-containing protein [Streptomyces indicus]|uniref:DUF4232 domain-containing protein n=1 Tax=Streptomyces indicus TaxID=417292 RepID=A0A1G9JNA9_9ACTN|nr:DUF4232 domain-containing protein [Streptomyces indicus]SDL38792.1 Protein of unknown function [Streptomyces indicus]
MNHVHARSAALIAVGLLTATATSAMATDASGTACRTDALTMAWAPGGSAQPDGKGTAGKQVDAPVTMKNTASALCTLHGYPEVVLKMGTETRGVVTETFRYRTEQKPAAVTLAPGDAARFTLTFISASDRDENTIDPGVAEITPPGNTTAVQLRWTWGAVAGQEAATHSGNVVSPVQR